MQVNNEVGRTRILYTTLWEVSGEGGGYAASVSNDERQKCDSSLAILEKDLLKDGTLPTLTHNTVIKTCFVCEKSPAGECLSVGSALQAEPLLGGHLVRYK